MRLINADKLIAQWEEDAKHIDDTICRMMTYGAINDVKKQPYIDIVLCEECKHHDIFGKTTKYHGCAYYNMAVDADHFCKKGERRADNE